MIREAGSGFVGQKFMVGQSHRHAAVSALYPAKTWMVALMSLSSPRSLFLSTMDTFETGRKRALPSVKFDGACCVHSDKLRDWIEQHSAEPPHRLVTPTAARGTRRSGKGRGEASQRVRRVLKKDPTLSITKLSERANVSHGYASQVHAHVLSEHHHHRFRQ